MRWDSSYAAITVSVKGQGNQGGHLPLLEGQYHQLCWTLMCPSWKWGRYSKGEAPQKVSYFNTKMWNLNFNFSHNPDDNTTLTNVKCTSRSWSLWKYTKSKLRCHLVSYIIFSLKPICHSQEKEKCWYWTTRNNMPFRSNTQLTRKKEIRYGTRLKKKKATDNLHTAMLPTKCQTLSAFCPVEYCPPSCCIG